MGNSGYTTRSKQNITFFKTRYNFLKTLSFASTIIEWRFKQPQHF